MHGHTHTHMPAWTHTFVCMDTHTVHHIRDHPATLKLLEMICRTVMDTWKLDPPPSSCTIHDDLSTTFPPYPEHTCISVIIDLSNLWPPTAHWGALTALLFQPNH